jgi:hypothetical protein
MLRDNDQRIVLRDLRWSQFLAVADARGERGNPRLHYLDGVLELVHSSWEHEFRKKLVSRCFEAWADAVGVDVNGCGSTTIMNRAKQAAAESRRLLLRGPRAPGTARSRRREAVARR